MSEAPQIQMKAITVCDATEKQLDWLVGDLVFKGYLAQGSHVKAWVLEDHRSGNHTDSYTGCWLHGGPVFSVARICCVYRPEGTWYAYTPEQRDPGVAFADAYGGSELIAKARCFVASHLGSTAQVPAIL